MEMKFKKGNQIKVTATDYAGKYGKIVDVDPDTIRDENHPDFDIESGEYLVNFNNSLQYEWFWESELELQ